MTEVKYAPEFVQALTAQYVAQNADYANEQAVIADFADEFGFTVAGLRAKLVREGVYNAKVKTVTRTPRKAELVAQLAELVNVPEVEFDTFEGATKNALETLVGRVRAIKEAPEA